MVHAATAIIRSPTAAAPHSNGGRAHFVHAALQIKPIIDVNRV